MFKDQICFLLPITLVGYMIILTILFLCLLFNREKEHGANIMDNNNGLAH
jgi:hypothetical protein